MFTLLGEVNLWTFDDNVNIKDTDFGAFRYHDRRVNNIHEEGKRSYCQKRGMVYVPTNKRGNKLKDSIKYLEEQLKDYSVIFCHWYNDSIIEMVLSNGLLIQIEVDISTGDIQRIAADKYLLGKVSDHISDVMITKNHLICTYNDNRVTLVSFTKSKRHIFDKISKLEPKLSVVSLCGPSGRRLDKKIQSNRSSNLILIWWKSAMNEVYPWSPTVKEHDRANIHLYRLTGMKLNLVCYVRTEFDPICIVFDACHNNMIHSIEQKVSRKGEVTIEWRTYEISQQEKLQRIAVISIPLPTHTSCVKLSPNQEHLLLCCIDGSVILYDHTRGTSTSIKAAFIPTLASWHSDGFIFVVGNDKGQFQYFDIALSCIKSQTLNEDATPANILDLSSYFSRYQPALLHMEWNIRSDLQPHIKYYYQSNSLFLLIFERGPMGVMKIIEGDNYSGDTIIRRYLSLSQVEQATSLLLATNWDTYPKTCMRSLNLILNHLFKLPLTAEHENHIQNALGSFHVPIKPISQTVEEEYGDEVRDLTRRFFHHLIRYQMFEKAFRLAIDLNDHDLFMDIHYYAVVINDVEMADAAKQKAEQILSRSSSCTSTHSTCSRESCSLCSDSSSDKGEESCSEECEISPERDEVSLKPPSRVNDDQIPPLPVLHPSLLNTKNFVTTPFNEPINMADYNLMSTSFNLPSENVEPVTYNNSLHFSESSPFFTSTSFDASFKPYPNCSSTSSNDNSHVFKNISQNLMTTSFSDLSVSECKPTSEHHTRNFRSTTHNKYIGNEGQCSIDSSILTSTSSSFSTAQRYNSISVDSHNISASTSSNVASNIMSTSFRNLVPNGPVFNDIPFSRSTKSCRSQTDLVSGNFTGPSIMNNLKSNFYNNSNNMMSTSFNYSDRDVCKDTSGVMFKDEDNQSIDKSQLSVLRKEQVDCNVPPPPPALTATLTNYLNNLPKKNSLLSRSTPGLTDIERSFAKFPTSRAPKIFENQSSVSNILQAQRESSNLASPRVPKLNYDIDYVPYHGSCDTLNTTYSPTNTTRYSSLMNHSRVQSNYIAQDRSLERKLQRIKSTNNTNLNLNREKLSSNTPPLPVVNMSNSHLKPATSCPIYIDASSTSNEKPKVKFSDTVTHILVPGVSQTYRHKRSTTTQMHLTDPRKELAESLPLCLGNEDYLKDFQPLSRDHSEEMKESSKPDESTKIKVVHFGLL